MDKTMSAEIRAFLKRVVVNQDGSLTFEGLLPLFGSAIRMATPSR